MHFANQPSALKYLNNSNPQDPSFRLVQILVCNALTPEQSLKWKACNVRASVCWSTIQISDTLVFGQAWKPQSFGA